LQNRSHTPLFSPTCSRDHRALHSFPTRRSSDLIRVASTSCPMPCIGRNYASAPLATTLSGCFRVSYRCAAAGETGWMLTLKTILDRKSTRLNSSHVKISYAVFCLKKKKHDDKTH